ncbi:Gfo/Idh/MocA family protein [Microbacterium sp. NPDC089696]|uniref:Gfo/Idh/MocA family protein n=1 Tax=Microbacterium sp. NPDC089696 TaxID=3364199 RepID=UPI00381BA239
MIHDVLLVGARGYGAVHLQNLERLRDRIRLLAIVDPSGGPIEGYGSDIPSHADLPAALASGIRPDVVVIATPTGTHSRLATQALDAGADVYLEKPPVASMAQFTQLLDAQARTGRAVQVGFQSFGSHALAEIAALGEVQSVAAWGAWRRDAAYWRRSPWAGRRTLDGAPVVDGVLTNALSHAVATALRIAGARRREDVERVDLDLYRANDIEADDTSAVRIALSDGRTLTAALTLAAAEDQDPLIEVRTATGTATLSYTRDELTIPDGTTVTTGRIDLFEELLDHREDGTALSSPLIESGAFMAVLEAVRTAPAPTPIAASRLQVDAAGAVSVAGIAEAVERTARAGALFGELDTPFLTDAPHP